MIMITNHWSYLLLTPIMCFSDASLCHGFIICIYHNNIYNAVNYLKTNYIDSVYASEEAKRTRNKPKSKVAAKKSVQKTEP